MMESYAYLCWESMHFNIFINAVKKGLNIDATRFVGCIKLFGIVIMKG